MDYCECLVRKRLMLPPLIVAHKECTYPLYRLTVRLIILQLNQST